VQIRLIEPARKKTVPMPEKSITAPERRGAIIRPTVRDIFTIPEALPWPISLPA